MSRGTAFAAAVVAYVVMSILCRSAEHVLGRITSCGGGANSFASVFSNAPSTTLSGGATVTLLLIRNFKLAASAELDLIDLAGVGKYFA